MTKRITKQQAERAGRTLQDDQSSERQKTNAARILAKWKEQQRQT